jgi:phage protein D
MPETFLLVEAGTGYPDDLTPLATSVAVEDHDRMVDEARLTFKDPDNKGAALIEKNHPIRIDLGWESEHAVLFEGVVTEVNTNAGADGQRTVAVVARDKSHPMTLEPKDVAHDPSPLDVLVVKIANAHGFTGESCNIECDPNPQLTGRDDRFQHNKTDYQFLQELADRWGARAFVEYNHDRSQFYWVSNRKLLKADALGTLMYCRGTQKLIEFTIESAASRAWRQKVVRAVDPVSGEAKKTTGDPPPPPAQTDAKPVAQKPLTAVGHASDPTTAERVAVYDPTRVLGLKGKGKAVGTVMLRAKGKVEIVGLAPWAEGDWYISSATHTWKDTTTAGVPSASYETSFTATR